MMAIGGEESGTLDILSSENDYFNICEEYAKTGLQILESVYVENPREFIGILELEALKYYDEFIEEK